MEPRLKFRDVEILGVLFSAGLIGLYCNDWLVTLALLAWWLIFKLVTLGDRIPVLFLALTFAFMQAAVGVFYVGFTGREMATVLTSDYRPAVMCGMAWVIAIALGVRLGTTFAGRRLTEDIEYFEYLCGWPILLAAYGVTIAVEGTSSQLAGDYPSIRHIIITLTVIRLGVLFLVLRRLVQPVLRLHLFVLVVGFEVVLGFSGFFAGFREPLMFGTLALLEGFNLKDKKRLAMLAVLVAMMAGTSLVWMGIRSTIRSEEVEFDTAGPTQKQRINRAYSLSNTFVASDPQYLKSTFDGLIDRMWTIYYPALAMARVPTVTEHTNGTLITAAIQHVLTPRVIFPDKEELPSDSDMVRKYTGLFVAGRESGTSIAFGAMAESYIDFGIPLMFMPPLLFGVLCGVAYGWMQRTMHHRELAAGTITVIFWITLYLFERSWANTLGESIGLFVYLGAPIVLMDRLLYRRRTVQVFDAEQQFRMPSEPLRRL
jgi:hypothetical protein